MLPNAAAVIGGVVCLIVLALFLKGDVKALFKVPFVSFSLEVKDKKAKKAE
jgi:hypothetical protein